MGQESTTGGVGGVVAGENTRALPPVRPAASIVQPQPGLAFDQWMRQMLTRYPRTQFVTNQIPIGTSFSYLLLPQQGTNLRFMYATASPFWLQIWLDQKSNGPVWMQLGGDILQTQYDRLYISATGTGVQTDYALLLSWTDTPIQPVVVR